MGGIYSKRGEPRAIRLSRRSIWKTQPEQRSLTRCKMGKDQGKTSSGALIFSIPEQFMHPTPGKATLQCLIKSRMSGRNTRICFDGRNPFQ